MKVAICIPCHSTAHAWFVQSLAQMITRTLAQGIERDGERIVPQLNTSVLTSSVLPRTRNRFVRDAMNAGADYMLWLDADHVFPDWTLLRLLSIPQPVIGITQPTRGKPTGPTAAQADGSRVYTTPEQVKDKVLERVRFMGLGICLMDMAIMNKLAIQAAREGRTSVYPLFDCVMTEHPDEILGEDMFFCNRLADAEIPIHVDHVLSWETKHIASLALGMDDALAQRTAFKALMPEPADRKAE